MTAALGASVTNPLHTVLRGSHDDVTMQTSLRAQNGMRLMWMSSPTWYMGAPMLMRPQKVLRHGTTELDEERRLFLTPGGLYAAEDKGRREHDGAAEVQGLPGPARPQAQCWG